MRKMKRLIMKLRFENNLNSNNSILELGIFLELELATVNS
jgi:hypothetical protein